MSTTREPDPSDTADCGHTSGQRRTAGYRHSAGYCHSYCHSADHSRATEHLLTPRLMIRPLSEEDQCQVMSLFQSLDVMRFSGTGPLTLPQSRQAFEQLRQRYQADPLSPRSVLLRGTVQSPGIASYQDQNENQDQNQWIGLCGFQPATGGQPDSRELAYRLIPAAWGQGFATEAARACCAHAFATTPALKRLTVWIEPPHRKSLRVAEKLGFSAPEERVRNGIMFRVLTLERGALILEETGPN